VILISHYLDCVHRPVFEINLNVFWGRILASCGLTDTAIINSHKSKSKGLPRQADVAQNHSGVLTKSYTQKNLM